MRFQFVPILIVVRFLTPKSVTRPDITKVEEFESRFDFQSLLSEAIKNVESLTVMKLSRSAG